MNLTMRTTYEVCIVMQRSSMRRPGRRFSLKSIKVRIGYAYLCRSSTHSGNVDVVATHRTGLTACNEFVERQKQNHILTINYLLSYEVIRRYRLDRVFVLILQTGCLNELPRTVHQILEPGSSYTASIGVHHTRKNIYKRHNIVGVMIIPCS